MIDNISQFAAQVFDAMYVIGGISVLVFALILASGMRSK